MAKKDKEKPKPKLFRIILFPGLAAGLIYWLSSQSETGKKSLGEVKGEKINKQIDQALPEAVKKQIEKINNRFQEKGDEVFKSTEEIVKETKLADEVEKIINQTIEEIEGFPEKQKEEIKKEIIKQVIQALSEKIEEDDKNKK